MGNQNVKQIILVRDQFSNELNISRYFPVGIVVIPTLLME
jgi:hypothetical protein